MGDDGDSSSSDLFFSMAAEGSSNNKFIEIYNPTGSEIDLSGYGFPVCSNGCSGSTYESWNDFTSGATIAAGGYYIVCHGSADSSITSVCDQTYGSL